MLGNKRKQQDDIIYDVENTQYDDDNSSQAVKSEGQEKFSGIFRETFTRFFDFKTPTSVKASLIQYLILLVLLIISTLVIARFSVILYAVFFLLLMIGMIAVVCRRFADSGMSWWTPLPSVGVTVATIVLALVALVYLMHNMDSVDYLNYYEYDSVIEDWLDDNIASVAVTYLFNVLFQISSLVASIMALIIFFRGQGYYAEKPKRQKIFLWVSVGSAVILALTVSSVFLWLNEAVTTCFPAVV